MQKIKTGLSLIILLFALSITGYAQNPTITIKKFLFALSKYKHNSTNPQQKKVNAQIKKYCNYVLNIDYMGRRAMRDNWHRLNARQKREFMSLLRKIINNIVYRDASRQLNDMRIRYRGNRRISAKRYKVYADIWIISEKLDMKAEYILEKTGNHYKIVDIFFDGESIVEDYHMEFNRIIRRHGIEGRRQSLLNRMRRTLRKDVIDDARKKRREKKRRNRRNRRR